MDPSTPQPNLDWYMYCFVPSCKNTTSSAPEKIFIRVPLNVLKRKAWCDAVGFDKNKKLKKTSYCCEDHLDLEKDLKNYTEYKQFGGRKILKEDVVPRYNLNISNNPAHGPMNVDDQFDIQDTGDCSLGAAESEECSASSIFRSDPRILQPLLKEDLENYTYFKTTGGRKLLKKGVVPRIFSSALNSALPSTVSSDTSTVSSDVISATSTQVESRVENLASTDTHNPSGTAFDSNYQLVEIKDELIEVKEENSDNTDDLIVSGDQENMIVARDDFLFTNVKDDDVLENTDGERDPLETAITIKHEVTDVSVNHDLSLQPTLVLDVAKSFPEQLNVTRQRHSASILRRGHSPDTAHKSCQVVQTGAHLLRLAPRPAERSKAVNNSPLEDSAKTLQTRPLYLLGRNELAKKIASTVVKHLRTIDYRPSETEWEEVIRNSLTIRDLNEMGTDIV